MTQLHYFGIKFLTLFLFIFCSCEQNIPVKPSTKYLQSNVTYFRDGKLCFAAIGSKTYQYYVVTSITCVPCDSINFSK